MKKTTKIITIVLSCLLLIGVMVGIGVSAAEDTTVSIYKKSLSYEGQVRITYALDVQNLKAGEIVKVAFSDEEMAAPQGNIADAGYDYVGGVEASQTIGGNTYPVVCSLGFEPAMMNKPVYATPVVVDANGNVVASGECEKFSIFEYCTERFAGSYTDDQFELYTALLEYGASVQEALITDARVKEVVDTYGYADAYYVVNATVKVDGAVAGTETLCYREADATINPAKTLNGKMFAGFEDAEGNAIAMYGADKTASSWNYYDTTLAIGNNDITLNYKTAGAIQTWDDITTPGASGYICNQSGAQLDSFNEAKTSAYTENGALSLYNNGWALVNIDNKNSKTGEVGKTYVFETDIMLEKPTSYSGDATMGVFYLANDYKDAYNKRFTYFPINYTDKSTGGNRYSIRLADNTATSGSWTDLAYLQFDEWYNVRIEYTVKVLGTTGSDIGSIKVYVDGEKVADYDSSSGYNTGVSNSTFGGIGWEAKGTGKYTFHFDNTYIATE